MSLIARCPACGTTFRVHAAQLAAKGGRVRCGKCAAVFNGVSNLLEGEAAFPALEAVPEAALEFLRGKRGAPHQVVWGFAVLLALLALAGQVLLHHRTETITLWPWARPHLAAACERLGCEVHLPRHPELLTIESSDVQSDLMRENAMVLNAVLRNRAPFAQEFPALELTLTDERDHAVVRRVLQPADYLHAPASERIAQGVPGGAESVLRVHLESSARHAVGYRLYLFFP